MHSAALSPSVAFKDPSLKAIRESGSFEHKLPILLMWYPAGIAVLSFTTIQCQQIDFTVCGKRIQVWFSNITAGLSMLHDYFISIVSF